MFGEPELLLHRHVDLQTGRVPDVGTAKGRNPENIGRNGSPERRGSIEPLVEGLLAGGKRWIAVDVVIRQAQRRS